MRSAETIVSVRLTRETRVHIGSRMVCLRVGLCTWRVFAIPTDTFPLGFEMDPRRRHSTSKHNGSQLNEIVAVKVSAYQLRCANGKHLAQANFSIDQPRTTDTG